MPQDRGGNPPFKTWTSDNQCFLPGKTNQGDEAETGGRVLPTDRSPAPTEGGWGGAISDSARQKKAERMGTEKWPRVYLPRQAWRRSLPLRGGARHGRFNECKRGGGTSVNAQQSSERMPGTGALQKHGGPGSGSGTCPGERRQDKAQRWSSYREQRRFEARARYAGRLWRTPPMDLEPLTRHR